MRKINYFLAAIILFTGCGKDDEKDLYKDQVDISVDTGRYEEANGDPAENFEEIQIFDLK